MASGIYKITNKDTGKFYIGSAKDIDWRWYEHKRNLNSNAHCNPKLQHSWNFYGVDKFLFEIIEEVKVSKLMEREQFYLDTFKPYMRTVGYNICPTAFGGDNITHNPNREKFVEKMSVICSGEGNPMFGRNHSEITIEKQKLKAKGRFTVDWFMEKYGKENGRKRYEERRVWLTNRKCNVSRPSPFKGRSRTIVRKEGYQGQLSKETSKDL